MTRDAGLGWLSIGRLGLVQSSLGAIVMLTSSLLNRVMVVEYALAAAIPAGLVGWHYAIQLSRPKFGHLSDRGGRRTPLIIGGMGLLAIGALLATFATLQSASQPAMALGIAILAYTLIGAGVGASGTSLLALLATAVAPARRPAAAATTWILMIAGIAITATIAGKLLDPFSPERLAMVAGGVVGGAFLLMLLAVAGVEPRERLFQPEDKPSLPFREAIGRVWSTPAARRFSWFILVAMLAYSMQDMILEPFAGLVFGMTPGQSTSLSGLQHGGVFLGMVLVGVGGRFVGTGQRAIRGLVAFGCGGSAAALGLLSLAALSGPGFPLSPVVFLLGFMNGIFAVSAVGAMMTLASADGAGEEGIKVGLWGAAQAIAFAVGGFLGASGVDLGRSLLPGDALAFTVVFSAEAALFLLAALIALRLDGVAARGRPTTHKLQPAKA